MTNPGSGEVPPESPEESEPQRTVGRRQTTYLIVGIAVLALVGLILILKPTSTPFELRGELSLTSDGAFSMNPRCGGKDGYDDINEGASVVVYDSGDKVIATGSLDEGRFASKGLDSPCVFKFAVAGVPDGEKFYQVQVSHRGKVAVQAEDAKAGRTSLSLG
jgi:hypothetical protein